MMEREPGRRLAPATHAEYAVETWPLTRLGLELAKNPVNEVINTRQTPRAPGSSFLDFVRA